MRIYFEIANLSFQFDSLPKEWITPDVKHFFHDEYQSGNRVIKCNVAFLDDYHPVNGEILVQDPYRIVMKNQEKEIRIFFMNPFSDIYGIYKEVNQNELSIETTRKIIDMRFVELLTLEKYLLEENAFVLHSNYISYQGNGIAFTAPSGTGKSTQGDLWENNTDATVINGDRSILQYKDEKWYIHSLPFCGSSFINKDVSTLLKAVVIVNRDCYDHCDQANLEDDLPKVMSEIMFNRWNHSFDQIFELVKKLFHENKVINLYCTPQKSAVDRLKEYLFYDQL